MILNLTCWQIFSIENIGEEYYWKQLHWQKDNYTRFCLWYRVTFMSKSKFPFKRNIIFLSFLGPHPWHMELLRLGMELKPQLLAYTVVTTMPNLSQVCSLHCSSQQCRILNTLCRARDQTWSSGILIRDCWATMGTPKGT